MSMRVQMSCPASGSILVRLQQLSPTAGGYVKLALLNAAGSNGITSVGFAPSGSQVILFSLLPESSPKSITLAL